MSAAEARRLGNDFIGPEHYLLCIIRQENNLALNVLSRLGVDVELLRERFEQVLKSLEVDKDWVEPVLNNDSRHILETARQIAMEFNHGWIGTEHVLLALVREEQFEASRLLRLHNISYSEVVQEVQNFLGGYEVDREPGAEKTKRKKADCCVALLTDFGESDWFVGSMKGVILSGCPQAVIIDLCHYIQPGEVL